ncbi:MAG: YdhR family protein, partial [Candidatus Zixiibacteriota bacterium]
SHGRRETCLTELRIYVYSSDRASRKQQRRANVNVTKQEWGKTAMAEKILQVNFKFSVTGAEYEQAASLLAEEFAKVAGLRWKIWLMNESESEAGGIYLFDDEASLQAYLEGPLCAKVKGHPALSEMSAKPFDVMAGLTATTRGPV